MLKSICDEEENILKVNSFFKIPPHYTGIVILGNTMKVWLFNRKVHRLNGPAVIWRPGDVEWWINDMNYEFEDWFNYVSTNHPEIDLTDIIFNMDKYL